MGYPGREAERLSILLLRQRKRDRPEIGRSIPDAGGYFPGTPATILPIRHAVVPQRGPLCEGPAGVSAASHYLYEVPAGAHREARVLFPKPNLPSAKPSTGPSPSDTREPPLRQRPVHPGPRSYGHLGDGLRQAVPWQERDHPSEARYVR